MPGASQLVAGAPTASATLARKGRVFIASGLQKWSCFRRPLWILPRGFPARGGRLPKGQRRSSTNESFETAVIAENILVPA